MTNEKCERDEKETKQLLNELFGNIKKVMKFYDAIPENEKVINKTKHRVFQIQQNICRYCQNKKVFTGCRHSVKRTVDECGGAFMEIGISDFDEKPTLLELTKLKLEILINSEDE